MSAADTPSAAPTDVRPQSTDLLASVSAGVTISTPTITLPWAVTFSADIGGKNFIWDAVDPHDCIKDIAGPFLYRNISKPVLTLRKPRGADCEFGLSIQAVRAGRDDTTKEGCKSILHSVKHDGYADFNFSSTANTATEAYVLSPSYPNGISSAVGAAIPPFHNAEFLFVLSAETKFPAGTYLHGRLTGTVDLSNLGYVTH